jgi:hypothetical protein
MNFAALKVDCATIGNCSAKTPTLDVAFSNAAHLIIGLVGGLAVVFIIVGGLQMVLSAGNPKQVQTAKQTITYAVIGVVVAIMSYAIVTFIAQSVK